MKIIYISLFVSLIFIGCGYKADPIYMEQKQQEVEK